MTDHHAADPVRTPAPGAELHLALDFANSAVALPGGRVVDLLDTPAGAGRWLAEHGLAPAAAGLREPCAGQLRGLREHVRALFAAHSAGHVPPPEALGAVNEAMTRVPAVPLLRWTADGPRRAVPPAVTGIVDHAMTVLATGAADLLTGADAERLTACDSPPCRRFLLRRGRRQWCSTRCGDRARAARAYARRGAQPQG